jgi:DNA-binding NtrC family response regulator
MLEELGHTVLSAGSAEEALHLVRSDERVGLLITDQVMPDMTGTELIAVVRAERPNLPAILATGYGDLSVTLDPLTGRLAKPFDEDKLSKAIDAVVLQGPSGFG